MDKSWIKWVLIAAFVVTLGFVYVYAHRALQESPPMAITVTPPRPPAFTKKPSLADNAKPEEFDAYVKTMQQEIALDKLVVDNYTAQVTAYKQEVEARITAAKANNPDASVRVTAFEKVIKETLGALVLTPLLGALLVYSGIKVAGDVAATRAVKTYTEVKAP
jgi:hypothetical protein